MKKLPAIMGKPCPPSRSNERKGVWHVQCSTLPPRAYEMLVKFDQGRARVGAKRVAKPATSDGSPSPAPLLQGRVELVNGMTWGCLHCNNNAVLRCGSCGTWMCERPEYTITCPNCGNVITPAQKRDTRTVKVAETGRQAAVMQQSGKPQPRLKSVPPVRQITNRKG